MTRLTTAELRAEQARLLALANELARRHWCVDYTGNLRLTNRDWKARSAAFAYTESGSVQEIRMSAVVNARLSPVMIADNLLHELVHWRLWTLGLPCADTDSEFIAECMRVGTSLSAGKGDEIALKRFIEREIGEAA